MFVDGQILLKFVVMKKILFITLLFIISCNSSKNFLSNSEILRIPAYNIENSSDSSLMKSVISSSKIKSKDSILFENKKYHISKIDSIIDSNNETDYSLIIKKDSLSGKIIKYLIPTKK